jgi:hypothetical protein
VCPVGQTATNLFSDDLENTASGNWTYQSVGSNYWYYPQNSHPFPDFDATYATSGTKNFWGWDLYQTGDYSIGRSGNVTIPNGVTTYLRFNHAFDFEDAQSAFDGGVVEYSTNNGASWLDAGSKFVDNGYNQTLATGFGNPLEGREAFGRESNGYVSSRVNLSTLGGQSIRFRYRIGTDSGFSDHGWFIDDVRVYTCTTPGSSSLSIGNATVTEGNSGTTNADFTVSVSPAAAGDVTVHYATSGGSATQGTDFTSTSGDLVIDAGDMSETISVPVIGDTTDESDETFTVTLSSPDGATIGDGSATGTITDDDGPAVTYRPDGKIKVSGQASFIGNDVYNLTGASQTKTAKAAKGGSKTYVVQLQNDATAADVIVLKGPGSTTKFTVKYLKGATGTVNITTAVVAGTYVTDSIPAGGSRTIRIVITAKTTAVAGTSRSVLLTLTSQGDGTTKDAVKAVLKVI